MGHVKKIEFDGRIILEIDYSDCNESGMINLLHQASIIGITDNRPYLVLSVLNKKNFLTPAFIKEVKEAVKQNLHLIEKQAIVGLTQTQRIIVMGLNIFVQRNFKVFDTKEEAVRFLLDKDSTDTDLPDYFRKKGR